MPAVIYSSGTDEDDKDAFVRAVNELESQGKTIKLSQLVPGFPVSYWLFLVDEPTLEQRG